MKKMSRWGTPVALFALGLSAGVGLNLPATAITSTATVNGLQQSQSTSSQLRENLQLVQGTLVGQCRAAKARIFVYTQRSATSPTIRTLAPNEQVTLADNGSGGFIAISAPAIGYVQASNLTACSGIVVKPTPTPTPTPTASLCRVVTYTGPEGLSVRRGPDKTTARVGGVKLGQRVTLRTSPLSYKLDTDKRAWVEITAPVTGWISYGFPSTNSTNIKTCP